uniref:Uncharacterized protein n=1 Tax=Oryza punctata TaxID=4537 RepID=A0A0E0LP44_ORYPU
MATEQPPIYFEERRNQENLALETAAEVGVAVAGLRDGWIQDSRSGRLGKSMIPSWAVRRLCFLMSPWAAS